MGYNDLAPKEKTLVGRIEMDYFIAHINCPISIDVPTTGQRLDADGNFVIGCRAGDLLATNLLHEMAHFAEREIDKLLKRPDMGWGFTYGKYWEIGSQWGYEAHTDQSIRRELRAWAYQHNLELWYGIAQPIEKLVAPVANDSAFALYHSYHDVERNRYRSEKDRLVIAVEEVRQLADTTYTLKAFNAAWNERIRVLRNQRYEDDMVTERKATA